MVTLKCASFSSRPKQTSLQRTTSATLSLMHACELAMRSFPFVLNVLNSRLFSEEGRHCVGLQRHHIEVCQFLVSSKADVIAKGNRFGIESYARIRTCYVIFSICFERFEFTSFFSGATPLHWSSHEDHIEVLNVTSFVFRGATPLGRHTVPVSRLVQSRRHCKGQRVRH
jgi:hypothetical protein